MLFCSMVICTNTGSPQQGRSIQGSTRGGICDPKRDLIHLLPRVYIGITGCCWDGVARAVPTAPAMRHAGWQRGGLEEEGGRKEEMAQRRGWAGHNRTEMG